jgi:hypothetical protein
LILLAVACSRPAPRTEVTCAQTSSCSQACDPSQLEACVAACGAKIGAKARPYWEALQRCSRDKCVDPCKSPTALSCKLCVMGNCAVEAGACLQN